MKLHLSGILLLTAVWAHASTVDINVKDEVGNPVPNASIRVGFANFQGKEKTVEGISDARGHFHARGSPNHSIHIWASKNGHYPAVLRKLDPNVDHELVIVLPQILDPRALYHVLRKYDGFPILPSFDTWYDFDMQVADWVAPHGKGKAADFRARLTRQFIDYYTSERNIQEARRRFPNYDEDDLRRIWGDWELTFEIEFIGRGAGVVEWASFHEYTEMPLPYNAPESGYQATWSFNYSNRASGEKRDNVGHFVKTRVIYDEDGNEVSANFAKFISDPWVGTQGEMLFEYYFNPDPNDRNLEYNGTNLTETQK